MLKRLFPAVFIILVMAFAAMYGTWKLRHAVNPDPNHTHADFAIWVGGTKLDFSDARYMSDPYDQAWAPSFLPVAHAHEGEEEGTALPGREYLHLHDGNGHVVHRHKPGLTFFQFLQSIDFDAVCKGAAFFPGDSCQQICITWPDGNACVPRDQARMFINEKEVAYDLSYDFQDGDQILVTYGLTEEQIQEAKDQMTDDACLYSQTCPWRGKPPAENCIADPTVPCVEP